MKSTVMLPKFTLTICVHFLSMAFLTFFDFLFLFLLNLPMFVSLV